MQNILSVSFWGVRHFISRRYITMMMMMMLSYVLMMMMMISYWQVLPVWHQCIVLAAEHCSNLKQKEGKWWRKFNLIICEKHIVFVNPILVGYGKLLQCNDNISHWLHGRERSRSQCSHQCSLEDAYLQRPACHIFGFAIYFGVPLHCTTFWISTWATRHVSFKEESRMIGQSLRWEDF